MTESAGTAQGVVEAKLNMEIRFAGGRGAIFVGPENVFVGPLPHTAEER